MNKKVQKGLVAAVAATMGASVVAPTAFAASQTQNLSLAAEYEAAYISTAKAIASNDQKELTSARVLVDALYNRVKGTADEYLATTLSSTLDPVQHVKLVAFMDAMKKAEVSVKQADINAAQALIVDMPQVWRNSYSTAMDAIQQKLIDKVVEATEKAKTSALEADKVAAQALLDEVKTVTNNAGVEAWVKAYQATIDAIVTTPKVESVTSNNLKSMTIKFNQAIDEDTITADTVQLFKGTNTSAMPVDDDLTDGFTSGAVNYVLSEDNKELTVVFETVNAQSTKMRVVVDGVKTETGKAVEKFEESYTVKDVVNPEIKGLELKNAKTFEVQFTEPVAVVAEANQVLENVKVDGNSVIGTVSFDYTTNKATVKLATALKAGNHEIKVYDVVDHSNLEAADKSFTINVVEDKAAPEIVSAKVTSKNVVTIETSEELDSLGTVTVNGTSATIDRVEGSLTKYKLSGFGTLDLSSIVEVTLKYKGQSDVAGNKVEETKTFVFKAADDTTLPTVTAQVLNESGKKNDVKLTFTKPMQTDKGTIKLLSADGKTLVKTVSVSAVAGNFNTAKTELVLTASDLGLTSVDIKDYKLEIVDMKDNTVRENLMAKVTLDIKTVDTKAPTVADFYTTKAGTTAAGDTAKIMFSEAMNADDLKNLSNYKYNGTTLAAVSGAKVLSVASDNKSVTLVIPSVNTDIKQIEVIAVRDTNGIMINPITKAVDHSSTSAGTNLNVASAGVAKDNNTIKVVMNTPLATVDPSSFVVFDTVQNKVVATFVGAKLDSKDSTNKTLILETREELTSDVANLELHASKTPTLTKNVYGTSLTADLDLGLLVDEITPEVKSVKKGDTTDTNNSTTPVKDTFTIEFTEGVTAANGKLEEDLIVKLADGTLLVPGTDYNVIDTDKDNDATVAGDTKVVIQLVDGLFADGEQSISVAIAAPRNIKDGIGNLLAEFAATTVNVVYANDGAVAPSFAVDYATEQTTAVVPTTVEYKLVGATTWTTGTGAKVALAPGTSMEFRVKATGTVPAGAVQTLAVAARPTTPVITVGVGTTAGDTNLAGTTTAMEYLLEGGSWTACTADMDLTVTAGKAIKVRVKATATTPVSAEFTHTFVAGDIKL